MDEDGNEIPGRWEPTRFEDSDDSDPGIIIDGGLTRNEFDMRTKIEMNRVKTIAPWHKESKFLKWRSGIDALYLGLSDSINGKYTGGFNKYHAQEVYDQEIQIADDNAASKWDIDIGEPYIEMPECCTGIHGDDGECLNWPIGYQNVEVALLRIHMYKEHLTHSFYSQILVLVCSESSKH
ncbi:MAG: hypothetical protein ACPG2Y_03370, partial [Acholeplasmataceae bacterium]